MSLDVKVNGGGQEYSFEFFFFFIDMFVMSSRSTEGLCLEKKNNNYRLILSVYLYFSYFFQTIWLTDCSNSWNSYTKVLLFFFFFFLLLLFSPALSYICPVSFYCTIRIISTWFDEETTSEERDREGKERTEHRSFSSHARPLFSRKKFFFSCIFSLHVIDWQNKQHIASFSCHRHLS